MPGVDGEVKDWLPVAHIPAEVKDVPAEDSRYLLQVFLPEGASVETREQRLGSDTHIFCQLVKIDVVCGECLSYFFSLHSYKRFGYRGIILQRIMGHRS